MPDETLLTNLDRSSSTLPSASSTHNRPSLLCASIPRSRKRSPTRPSNCLVDFSVTSRSRSRDGSVDGAKCSFRRTLCFMMFSLLRADITRESGEPAIVRGPVALEGTMLKPDIRTILRYTLTFRMNLAPRTNSIVAYRRRPRNVNVCRGQASL